MVDHWRKVVRDHHFLEQAPADQLQSEHDALRIATQSGPELRQERRRPFDWAGEDLGEIRDEQRRTAEPLLRIETANIDVDQITRGRERVERETDRRGDAEPR